MCATQGCFEPSSGKSKYCREHKAIARQAWLDKVRQGEADRDARRASYAEAWRKADAAGRAAADAAVPTPMVVTQHENPLDDGSPVKQQWHVPQGVCGFAWISVRPGNCGFAHWLKKQGLSKGRAYGGGVQIWVSQYGQSYELKMAYAQAAADVLKAELGGKVRVYASGRLD